MTTRVNASLTLEAAERLRSHCFLTGRQPGAVLSDLVLSHLCRVVIMPDPSDHVDRSVEASQSSPLDLPATQAAGWQRLGRL